jgi:ppGpp synthetase/RelA/SpoT-type nucleotidyltranferase
MTLSEEIENEEQVRQVEIPQEGGLTTVYDSDEDGNIIGIRTVMKGTIQEALFDEQDRARVPAGSAKGGEWVKGSGNASPAAIEREKRRDKYEKKFEEFREYYELNEDNKGAEPIHLTDKPNAHHAATAYRVLESYPDMNEEQLIEWAWQADQIRSQHELKYDEMINKLNTLHIPNSKVSGRIKSRFSMLDKMARKQGKYKSLEDMKDVSGFRVIVNTIQDSESMNNWVNTNLIVDNVDDYNKKPLDGYRAIQFDIINDDDTMSELQIKTPNQAKWADFFHDRTYKVNASTDYGREVITHFKEIKKYSHDMSDYYYKLDMGDTTALQPKCPIHTERIIGCL